MIEDNKFYTPNISEFYVGFECEWQCKIRNETWNKQICDVDLLSIVYDQLEHADEEEPFEEQFRVKYLDEEDIEECGFEKIDANKYTHLDNELYFRENTGRVAILKQPNYLIPNYAFDGTIKNKNELKMILKMLGINEEK